MILIILLIATSLAGVSASLICLIAVLILFALVALNVPSSKVSLGWAGMFFIALALALA